MKKMDALAGFIGLSELTLIRVTTVIVGILVVLRLKSSSSKNHKRSGAGKTFKSRNTLNPKDQALLDMLDPLIHNYVITDPAEDDNPIVYASDHFCSFTQYSYDEIVGRNCRFLQGEKTQKCGQKHLISTTF